MKHLAKFLLTCIFASYAVAAYASCSTNTTTYGGKIVTCTTCCYYGNCNTTCF
jgi:hypothetical protein